MEPSIHQTIHHYVEEHLLSYQDIWELFNTHYHTYNQQNIQELVLTQCQQRGITTQILGSQQTIIYGELNNNAAQTLLFYVHCSAQSDAAQQLVPFLTSLFACDTYQNSIGPLPINIKWLIDTHEREGIAPSALSDIVTKNAPLLQADGCIWYKCVQQEYSAIEIPILALGSRGLLCVEMSVKTARIAVSPTYGAVVPNAAWRLLWSLCTLKDAREEILIEGFYDTLVPIEEETTALLHMLPANIYTSTLQWGINEVLLGLQGLQLHYTYLLTPTCTVTMLNSGEPDINKPTDEQGSQSNIPAEARAKVHFYLVPEQHPEDIFNKLQRHLAEHGFHDIQVHLHAAGSCARTPLTDPFVHKVLQATTSAYQQRPYIFPMQPAYTPIAAIRQQLTIPVVIVHPSLPPRESGQKNITHALAMHTKQMAILFEELHSNHLTTSAGYF